MEREELAALEKRVAELRGITAAKAVLARTLTHVEPFRYHAEISTALLAIVVLVVFLAGRQIGVATSSSRAACSPVSRDADASITLERRQCFGDCPAYEVTLDNDGNVTWDGRMYVEQQRKIVRRVSASDAHALINRFATACVAETTVTPVVMTDVPETVLTVHFGDRHRTIRHAGAVTTCNGASLESLEAELDQLTGTPALVGHPPHDNIYR